MRLIYFSPVRWDSYEQRPHYVVRHFLAMGGSRVTWINPYPARLPQWNDVVRVSRPERALELKRPDSLTVLDISAWPIDPLPMGRLVNRTLFWRTALEATVDPAGGSGTIIGVGRPTALAAEALRTVAHAWSFYDAMDDFPEFYRGWSRRATRAIETEIAARVSRIFASSTALARKFSAAGNRLAVMRNAYDMALLPPPRVIDRSSLPFGFLGCLGGWLDWQAIRRLALEIHPRRIVMVGPSPAPSPNDLPGNIEHRPQCHQAESVAYLDTFAAGLIPFRRDRLTSGIDPIKFYQYRGAGLPVLSTRFGEMAERSDEGTFFFEDGTNASGAIAAAMSYRPSPASLAQFRDANTWTRRFAAANLFTSL